MCDALYQIFKPACVRNKVCIEADKEEATWNQAGRQGGGRSNQMTQNLRVNEQGGILSTTPSSFGPILWFFVCGLYQIFSKPIASGRQQETKVGKFRESETRTDFEDHSLLGPSQLVSQPAHIKCLLRFFVRACSNTCRYPYPSLYTTLLYFLALLCPTPT